ncbi:MAG: FHA domain-containing protein [SAR202 cluster bacterium]|jgi:hypothetical protein|nr:FHA domain-containing protein [SAR202 cluster bacterium]MDP6715439.1 FHA domain-containing protein [SAR202 cluster bacterium]
MEHDTSCDSLYVLEAIIEGNRKGPRYPVSEYVTIGRGSEDFEPDVLIPEECRSASRNHAALDLRGDSKVLSDGSRLGTLRNGALIHNETVQVSSGDEFIFGRRADGWRVRLRYVGPSRTTDIDDDRLLELLTVSEEDPRQIRIGQELIDENLGRAAFELIAFLSERRGLWYPLDRLETVLWPDGLGPIAKRSALANAKRKINDLLRPHLLDQYVIESKPFLGYRMKSELDRPESS